MELVTNLVVAFVALSHAAFLVLEMFFWNHAVGQKIFSMTPEFSAASATLAANQGLYNGFLAAGLIWALLTDKRDTKIFFLACIVVAGVFGAATAKFSILYTQAIPAAIGLLLVLVFAKKRSAAQ